MSISLDFARNLTKSGFIGLGLLDQGTSAGAKIASDNNIKREAPEVILDELENVGRDYIGEDKEVDIGMNPEAAVR